MKGGTYHAAASTLSGERHQLIWWAMQVYQIHPDRHRADANSYAGRRGLEATVLRGARSGARRMIIRRYPTDSTHKRT